MIRKINVVSPFISLAVKVAQEKGVEPALVCALVMVESSWNGNAQNHGHGDEDRGGAWGLGQLTLATARSLGFNGPVDELLDPRTNLELVADLIKDNTKESETTTDLISRYNSGKPSSRAPAFTLAVYVPRVLNYLQQYRAFLQPRPAPSPDATGDDGRDQHLALASAVKPV